MKKTIMVLVLTLISLYATAQIPEWQWASQAGGNNEDCGFGIAVDDLGNSYVTGYFSETADFGDYSISSSGDWDVFVAKMDEEGNWLWATNAGGGGLDIGTEITIDNNGNSYITGVFEYTATFGSYTLTSLGEYDVFTAKLDADGSWLWATQAGGNDLDISLGIATDNVGNIFVSGYFYETSSFGSYTLTSSGDEDIFVAKLDTNGNWLWAIQTGASEEDGGNGLAVDDDGNSFVTGYFSETVAFGSSTLSSPGSGSIFIAKLDTNGNWIWAAQAVTSEYDWIESNDIVIDIAGNSYITGSFEGSAAFGSYSFTSIGEEDAFVAKLDADGNWLWAVHVSSSDDEENVSGNGITLSDENGSNVTGYFSGVITFGSFTLTGSDGNNIFVAKLDSDGDWLWATYAAGVSGFPKIAMDSDGNSYVTGDFDGTATFGSHSVSSNEDDYDIFVAKLGYHYPTVINVPADQPTIQAGIDIACTGDTVLVQPGTYIENINYNGKNITVASLFLTTADTTYISQTIIDGDLDGSVVTFESGEDSTAVLCGFTITNGLSSGIYPENCGGGIYCSSSDPTLKYLVINENTAEDDGGGIWCTNSKMALEYVTISNNSVSTSDYPNGGGIYCVDNSNLILRNVTISYNSAARDGGGICSGYSDLEIENCYFINNEAQNGGSGGAINYGNWSSSAAPNTYQISINNCYFFNNSASNSGGGIRIAKGNEDITTIIVLIEDCEFTENLADNYCGLNLQGEQLYFSIRNCIFDSNEVETYAGAGGFSRNSSGEMINCLIFSNTADWNSGGISVWSGAHADIINCTFVDNSCTLGAGIAAGMGATASLTNCIFWGNDSDQIALIDYNDTGGIMSVDYCDIQNGMDSVFVDTLSTLIWGVGNIDQDPLFMGTGDHPFQLQDLSLCVNTGIPDTTGLNLPEFDLAGNPRVYGSRIDMGAYENQNVVMDIDVNLLPEVTRLYQNYPNPFNPNTVINFQLSEDGKVNLSIFNIRGQLIKTLVDQFRPEGAYSVVWSGRDDENIPVASGIYFYQLQINNKSKTRKMILVK